MAYNAGRRHQVGLEQGLPGACRLMWGCWSFDATVMACQGHHRWRLGCCSRVLGHVVLLVDEPVWEAATRWGWLLLPTSVPDPGRLNEQQGCELAAPQIAMMPASLHR